MTDRVEAAKGLVPTMRRCPHCHGKGWVRDDRCSVCQGIGSVPKSQHEIQREAEQIAGSLKPPKRPRTAKHGPKGTGGTMSKLKAVSPETIEKRLKCFMFGAAGSGKTTAAIQFPHPYLIDAERGAENDQYVKALRAAGGAYLACTDLDEIIDQVHALGSETHEFRTLVIDPMTVPYNDALDKSARELAAEKGEGDGTEFGRHKARADRKMKRLSSLLLNLDMNVIVTSHQKTRWGKVGNEFREMGTTFDCYAKLDYLFDLVFELERRGQERIGIVRKSRLEPFPEGDSFAFSYDAVADRYGRQVLEREAAPVPMASAEQVARIQQLLEAVKVEPEVIQKWQDRANAERWEEFSEEAAAKIIEWIEKKIAAPAATQGAE
jgi:hypothetical protein